VYAATNSRTAYLNGVGGTPETTSSTPTANRMGVGILARSALDVPHNGAMANLALWRVALTEAEIGYLARGAHPTTIRPADLVEYWELDRIGPITGLIRGTVLTPVNGGSLTVGPTIPGGQARRPVVLHPADTGVREGYGVAHLTLGAVGFGPAPVYDTVQLFDGGSGAVDTTKLAAGVYGANLGTWRSTTGVDVDHTVFADHAVTLPFPIDVGGVYYDGAEAVGITFDHTGAPEESDQFDCVFPADTYQTMQALMLAQFDIEDNAPFESYSVDAMNMQVDTGSYGVASFLRQSSGGDVFRAHTSGGNGKHITRGSTDWVQLYIRISTITGLVEVCAVDNATGAYLGSSVGSVPATAELYSLRFQDYLRSTGIDKEGAIRVKLIALREDIATFPLPHLTVAPPVAVSATQTDVGEVTVVWTSISARHRVERRIDAGSWTSLDADYRTDTYVDTGLNDGESVEYRVIALAGSYESAAEDGFDPVEINNPGEGYGVANLTLGASGAGARVSYGYGAVGLTLAAQGRGDNGEAPDIRQAAVRHWWWS
ncbi:MAG TPA: hypothetical protein VGK49_12235, partial [Ilumatobacteraceae bacterium]